MRASVEALRRGILRHRVWSDEPAVPEEAAQSVKRWQHDDDSIQQSQSIVSQTGRNESQREFMSDYQQESMLRSWTTLTVAQLQRSRGV